jgi:hypothetical protein
MRKPLFRVLHTSLQLCNADSSCTIIPIANHDCWLGSGGGCRPHIFVAGYACSYGLVCPWGCLGGGRFLGAEGRSSVQGRHVRRSPE